MREQRPCSALFLAFAVLLVIGCNPQPNISGVWKGSIQQSDGKDKWQGPAELTLNQKEDGIAGTLAFT